MQPTADQLFAAALQFSPSGRFLDLWPYGNGNVHDTFLVTVAEVEGPQVPLNPPLSRDDLNPPYVNGGQGGFRFILQRLNTRVFRRPEQVMGNLRLCTEHVQQRLKQSPMRPGRSFELPQVLPARDDRDYYIDSSGSFWRALSFIEAARTYDTILDLDQAREVGFALGTFHRLLSDLSLDQLADTLPGFHVTPRYLAHYDEVLGPREAPQTPEAAYAMKFVEQRRALVHVLEEAKVQGRLQPRPIHGDPKVNNVLLDTATGHAVALVDLDTVKPGLVHYDIGDCLRSGGNPLGEETGEWESVYFDPDLGRALLQGYLSPAREFLTAGDYDYLYEAIRLIALELGLRFFTDYLEGNVYFKASHPDHNLDRALVQFRLTESIESQEKTIRAMIRDLR